MNKIKKDAGKKYVFMLDQVLHIAIIVGIAYIYAIKNDIALNQIGIATLNFYNSVISGIPASTFIRGCFVILLNLKPANVLIREINKKMSDEPSGGEHVLAKKETEYKDAGKLIGDLERLLIIVMVVLKQYAAVGLIFTAKSITRYDKISREPPFAEYYLVGTLLSVFIAVISAMLI